MIKEEVPVDASGSAAAGNAGVNPAVNKVNDVRDYFEAPQQYFAARGFDIRIRAETVRELTQGLKPERVLDIGCGDGSISLPLLNANTKVTFLDLSTQMTAIVKSRVPAALAGNVELLNTDFMAADLTPAGYDLVICLGVLAHVDSPPGFVAKLASLLKPGGTMIIEFADCENPMGRLLRFYQWVCALRKPRSYALNALSWRGMKGIFESQNLALQSVFRYSLLGFSVIMRPLGTDTMYKIVRRWYGTPQNNRNRWLGDECICVLSKPAAPQCGKGT